MRVMTGHNPYAHHQHKANNKDKGFADMFADMAANKHCKDEPKAHKDNSPVVHVTLRGFHCCCATQIKPDKEWFTTARQPNAESKGDEELTGPQILFLQEHYDIENLSPGMRQSLLCDLADMGVLSAADINSEDQSKVDDVLEKIKSFKMGVISGYVEFPEQPELIISDGSDPELRGLSDDEKFAAIVKKYEGGATTYSFGLMVSALYHDKLITREQLEMLSFVESNHYSEKRFATERAQGYSFNLDLFNMNYRVTMDGLLKAATSSNEWSNEYYSVSMDRLCKVDQAFVREFASKFKALS